MNDFREYKAAFLEQNDLKHFGILGMKWGVRRYQNPDGTLTPAGKKRYDKYMEKSGTHRAYSIYGKDEKLRKDMAKLADSYAQIAKKYGSETPEEREQYLELMKKREEESNKAYEDLVNDGFKQNDGNDFVEKEDSDGDIIALELGGNGFKKAKESYDSFKKNKKEHVEAIVNQILKNDRWDGWTDDLKQLEKEIRSAKNAYEFRNDGWIYGFIGNYGIPELGYHSIEIEYDPLTKRLHQQSLAG